MTCRTRNHRGLSAAPRIAPRSHRAPLPRVSAPTHLQPSNHRGLSADPRLTRRSHHASSRTHPPGDVSAPTHPQPSNHRGLSAATGGAQ